MADIKTIESKVSSTPHGPAANEKDAEMLRFLEEMTANADAVQEKVLAEILSRNAKTEYLERSNLGGATDREAFNKKVPVVTYEDILPYIQRIANGDGSAILSAQPISELLTSTGTSDGKKKMIPTVKEDLGRRLLFHTLTMAVMNLYFPGLDKGKGLYFFFAKSDTRTPGGLMARPLLTSVYKSEQLKSLALSNVYTSPLAAILCTDSFQSMYTQMLCGVYQRLDVLRIGAVFASSLLRAIRFLQLHWEQLAADIASGTLNSRISDASVREAVSDLLRPNQELAQFLTCECTKGDWSGIVRRVWPNTKYLDVIVTGTMAQYITTLEYYSGGLPMASTVYASSECYFGINLRPMSAPSEVSYTIMPNMGYFEFLPVNSVAKCGIATSQLVDLAHVEVGKKYEVVVTTYSGLYRYRVGDILRVTGFHNSSPQFQFVRRKNVLLSIDTEKTDEPELQKAVETASELLKPYNATVVDYTSHAYTKSIPGHYVIYWELLEKEQGDGKGPVDEEVIGKCCLAMEESLNLVYRMLRSECMSIGPLEIRVVRSGTFEELMDYAISREASFNQYKVPRCVTSLPILEMIDSRVVSKHFSPATPKWTSGQSD